MANKALGKHYRKGVSVFDMIELFHDEESCEAWFKAKRWPKALGD